MVLILSILLVWLCSMVKVPEHRCKKYFKRSKINLISKWIQFIRWISFYFHKYLFSCCSYLIFSGKCFKLIKMHTQTDMVEFRFTCWLIVIDLILDPVAWQRFELCNCKLLRTFVRLQSEHDWPFDLAWNHWSMTELKRYSNSFEKVIQKRLLLLILKNKSIG